MKKKSDWEKKREKEIYRIIDSFLVEAKDQHGRDRSLAQLNLDRHLAAERILALLQRAKQEGIEEVCSGLKLIHQQYIREKANYPGWIWKAWVELMISELKKKEEK